MLLIYRNRMKQNGWASCLLCVCLVLGRLCCGNASKILLLSYVFKSHVDQFVILGNDLIDNGHDVYMLMAPSYPYHDTLAGSRIKLINYHIKDRDLYGMDQEDRERMFDSWLEMTPIEIHRFNNNDGNIQFCTNPLGDEEVVETLRALNLDLAVVDICPNSRCLLILPYRLELPYVSLSSAYEPWLHRVPALPSFVPLPLGGKLSEKMTFVERLQNTLTLVDWTAFPQMAALDDGLVNKYAPEKPAVSLHYLAGKSLLYFFNTDILVDYPRPLMPNEINIGGISTKPAKNLPANLAEFLDSATSGAIVVSFGTTYRLPFHINRKLLAAFSKLEQKVIWKHHESFMGDVPDHIKISKWIPQNDIMGHPKCKLLITHGGSNSQFEALYHGVPVMTFPICSDQPYNAKRAEYHGFGITMDVRGPPFTADEVVHNIHRILSNNSFSENIKKRSKIFHSRTMSSREKAVYWIEHVLQYGGDYMHSHGLDLPWYQYLMLDILALLLGFCHLGLYICYKLTRLCYGYKTGRGHSKQKLQ